MDTEKLNSLPWKNLRMKVHGINGRQPIINGQIFLGDGGRLSMIQCYALHKLLEEAFQSLGSEQQNGLQGYKYNVDTGSEDMAQVVAVIQQIAIGLTGHEVIFREAKNIR